LCALARPVVHGLRYEYQDRVNFVILDYDVEADTRLAKQLGVHTHPAFAAIAVDGVKVTSRQFGPLQEPALRAILDGLAPQ